MNKRYVVTKGSDDGTFNVGDHIWFEEDGAICCIEAEGWINPEDAEEASKGMEYKIDEEWRAKEIRRRQEEIIVLESFQ